MKKNRLAKTICSLAMASSLLTGVVTVPQDVKAGEQQASSVYMSNANGVFGFWARGYYFDESYHKATVHLIKDLLDENDTPTEVARGHNYGYLAVYASSSTIPFNDNPYLAADDFQSYMTATLNLTK